MIGPTFGTSAFSVSTNGTRSILTGTYGRNGITNLAFARTNQQTIKF